ncbi:hypothetical protein BGZ76_011040 [Entomortierella beljakovae]|nr:hypothetical protein BGZ76_011040 [Entomortierella beljakovae]
MDILVTPDLSNAKHVALVNFLKHNMIPVFPGTRTIDFSNVRRIKPTDPPILKLAHLSSHPSKTTIALELLKTIIVFFKNFKEFYQRHLSQELFNDMAQYYIADGLRESGFAEAFERELFKFDEPDRKWTVVRRCLGRALHIETLRGEVASTLFRLRPGVKESHKDYCDRIQTMVEVLETEDPKNQLLIEAIVSNLPVGGREIIMKNFGSASNIESTMDLVNCLWNNPSIIRGWHDVSFDYYTGSPGNSSASTSTSEKLVTKPCNSNESDLGSIKRLGSGRDSDRRSTTSESVKGQMRARPAFVVSASESSKRQRKNYHQEDSGKWVPVGRSSSDIDKSGGVVFLRRKRNPL